MKKNIKVKKAKSGEVYLDLKDFSDLVDINKVKFYSLEETHDVDDDSVALVLKFYDSKKKLLMPKAR